MRRNILALLTFLLLGMVTLTQAQEDKLTENAASLHPVGMLEGSSAVTGLQFIDSAVAIRYADGSTLFWDTLSQTVDHTVQEVVFSDDVITPDGTIQVMANSRSSQLFFQQSGDQVVLAGLPPVRFSPDGQWVAYSGDLYSVQVSSVEKVMSEAADHPVATLPGHFAPITDLAFSGNLLATASQDGSISVWDVPTGTQKTVLMGHHQAVTKLAFSPDSSVLISGDSSGLVLLWGLGTAISIPLPGMPNDPVSEIPTSGIIGYPRGDLQAGYHPQHPVGCTVKQFEPVLAVGQSVDGTSYLVYSSGASCEGAVWITPDPGYLDWEDAVAVASLPVMDMPAATPLMRLNNVEAACENATAGGNTPAGRHVYPPFGIPNEMQSTLASGIHVLICHDYPTVTLENCHYLGPGNYSYIFTRIRTDDVIRLVNYATGAIFAEHRFRGQPPPLCPAEVTRDTVYGELPLPTTWVPWVMEMLGAGAELATRTVIQNSSQTIYAAANDNSAVITTLERATPVNLIGRDNSSTWGVVLLPDLTKGWLPLESLAVATQTQVAALPVISEQFVQAETLPAIAFTDPTTFRPLGRFSLDAYEVKISGDGYYIATIEESLEEPGLFLSLWDIRQGQVIWQVPLTEREVQEFAFSPNSAVLYIKTVMPYPDKEEIRLSFYEVATGNLISQTENIDILNAPTIPGNMPQPLNADVQYTQNGQYVVISYWRRIEEPQCAVWEVATASLVWKLPVRCGEVDPTGTFMIVPQEFTDMTSAYRQLAVYEVQTGDQVEISDVEAMGYNWLDARRILIYRPYGEPPVIWDVTINQKAVVEQAAPLGTFSPLSLDQVMAYTANETVTYVWDKSNGELLAQTSIEGIVVEQEERTLLLQGRNYWNNPPNEMQPSDLIAVELTNNREVWRISDWQHGYLHIYPDGKHGVAFNVANDTLDLLDLVQGEIIASLPCNTPDFYLTENWDWLIFSDGYQYIVLSNNAPVSPMPDPPTAQSLTAITTYREFNTSYPNEALMSAGEYVWVVSRTQDNLWLQVEDIRGRYYWVPATDLTLLTSLEQIPVYTY